MVGQRKSFTFLDYLAEEDDFGVEGDTERIPPLTELSKTTKVSIASLREQLEVARTLGLVEVRPRTGIRRLAYSFTPAISQSLSYAITRNKRNFDLFSDMRKKLEAAYWREAICLLTPEDNEELQQLIKAAWEKLEGSPVRLPHREHRQLHMLMFHRLENPFMQGILEAYWDAYEEVGFSRYQELEYLKKVWSYHRDVVDAITDNDLEASYKLVIEHMDLLHLITQEV